MELILISSSLVKHIHWHVREEYMRSDYQVIYISIDKRLKATNPFSKKLGQSLVVRLQIMRSKWASKYVDRVILLCQDLYTLRSTIPIAKRMWK